jgi:hypothetical protein
MIGVAMQLRIPHAKFKPALYSNSNKYITQMSLALNAFKETLKCNTQVTLFKRITLTHLVFLGLQENI